MVMAAPISNADLRLEDLPAPTAEWQEINAFALTFNGYTHWGSFEKCAEVANTRRQNSLTDLRTCLFFEQRRWHHFGDEPDEDSMRYIRSLVQAIHDKLLAGERS